MQRRQFLAIACASTLFADACKKGEPTPATIVQGTITDAAGKPVMGLEVEYMGSGGGTGIFYPPAPYQNFTEKTITDPNGFFRITKVVPEEIEPDGTQVMLSTAVFQKYTTIETTKNGKLISGTFVIAQQLNIELGKVNEYLVTLK